MTSPSPATTNAPPSKGRQPSQNPEAGERPNSPCKEPTKHPLEPSPPGRGLLHAHMTRSKSPTKFKTGYPPKPSNDQESSKAKESNTAKENEVLHDGALTKNALNEAQGCESAKENDVLNRALKKKSLNEAEGMLLTPKEHEISGAGTSKSRDLNETKESPAREKEHSPKGSEVVNLTTSVELKESGNSSQYHANDHDVSSKIPSNIQVKVPRKVPSNVCPSIPSPILSTHRFFELNPNIPFPVFAINTSCKIFPRTPSPRLSQRHPLESNVSPKISSMVSSKKVSGKNAVTKFGSVLAPKPPPSKLALTSKSKRQTGIPVAETYVCEPVRWLTGIADRKSPQQRPLLSRAVLLSDLASPAYDDDSEWYDEPRAFGDDPEDEE